MPDAAACVLRADDVVLTEILTGAVLLQPGDEVTVTVEGIGSLSIRIAAG